MRCTSCDAENPIQFQFCGYCGKSLATHTGRYPVADLTTLPPTAERRQLTVLFCDLVGSVPLSQALDPEDLRDLMGEYLAVGRSAIHRARGEIAQVQGDGIIALFGYPRAHEDDVRRAVDAGLEILAGIARLNSHLERRRDIRLDVRVGVHTGLVVTADQGQYSLNEPIAFGDAPNIAERLQSLATPGTFVISAATERLVRGYFECESLGIHTLKGVYLPMEVFRVIGETGAQSRFEAAVPGGLGAMVGRKRELGRMVRHWNEVKEGRGKGILLRGEAGIGKSRLIEAFDRLAGEEASSRLRYYCSEHHENSTLHPVARQMERGAGLAPEDSRSVRLEKLQKYLALVPLSSNDLELLAELLGLPGETGATIAAVDLSPQRKRQKTFSLLLRIVEVLAAQGPVLVLFEDLHWIDPTSLELIDRLVARLDTMRVLVVATHRPDFLPPWAVNPNVISISLERLDDADRVAVVSQVAGNVPMLDRTVREIADRSDGVPLFIEELTRAVLHAGDGATDVPATLQSSLQARLDRLGKVAREVAQFGAAIGRQFQFELLLAVSSRQPAELDSALNVLELAGLVSRRGLPPQATYTFKHALVQDAAYATLLRGRRRELHATIARELAKGAETGVASLELLAYHWSRAGMHTEAIYVWRSAALQSVQRGAFVEAESHLRNGLNLLEHLPRDADPDRQEVTLQNALGNVLIARRGYTDPETQAAFSRARQLAEQLDDTRQGLRAFWGLGTALLYAGRLSAVLAMLKEAEPLVERNGHLDARLAFTVVHGNVLLDLGRIEEARIELEHLLAIDVEPDRDRERAIHYGQSPRISALGSLSIAALLQGRPAHSLAHSKQCLSEAEAVAHKPMLCLAHAMACRRSWLAGDSAALTHHADILEELVAEQQTSLWLALGKTYKGWSLAEASALDRGIELMREGLTDYQTSGANSGIPLFQLALGRAYARSGCDNEARQYLDLALVGGATGEEQWILAAIRCERSRQLFATKDFGSANAEVQQAIALSRAQGAVLFQERAEALLRDTQGVAS